MKSLCLFKLYSLLYWCAYRCLWSLRCTYLLVAQLDPANPDRHLQLPKEPHVPGYQVLSTMTDDVRAHGRMDAWRDGDSAQTDTPNVDPSQKGRAVSCAEMQANESSNDMFSRSSAEAAAAILSRHRTTNADSVGA